MDITGKIIAAMEPRSGVSQRSGTPWKSQEFVIEWYENQYPRHCQFRVFGADRLDQMNLQVGQEYTISFDLDAHEYNGRWYNDVNAWRAVAPQAVATGAPVAAPAATPAPAAADIPAPTAAPAAEAAPEDDLPF